MRPTLPRTRTGLAATTAVIGSVSLALGAAPAAAATRSSADAAVDRTPTASLGLVATTPPPRASFRVVPAMRAAEVAPMSYTIRAGDTISAVAARFGLNTADVLAWNGLGWSTIIRPGQVIALAAPAAAPPAADPASAAPPVAAPAATHVVVGGDTLWAIGRAHGVTVAALLAANGLGDGDGAIIYPGQTLVVPASAAAAPAPPAAAAPAPPAASPSIPADVVLDAEQIANARIIIQVGRGLGVSDRGIAIALATAMVESWIRNLDWGDRDSLGLFQQRPSTGWGTEAEVRDPYRAAAAFFGGASDPNGSRTRGLLDIVGWESLDFGAAAQTVQISAYPDRYAPWEQQAYAWLAALG